MRDIFELTSLLIAPHGVAGDEKEIAAVITDMVAPFADEVYTDVMGNVVAHKKGNGKKVMFSAHMDTIGGVATYITDEGYIRFCTVGGLSPIMLLAGKVRFKSGLCGVIGKDGKAEIAKLKVSDLYVDIGAKNAEEAGKLVKIGDSFSYGSDTYRAGEMIVSRYLDNRIGCACLVSALERLGKTDNDLYFVFSVQEEVGLRGARTSSYAIAPDYAYAVDVTGSGDTPDPVVKMQCSLGDGASIKIMDQSLICHPAAIKIAEQAAEKRGIKYQHDILTAGGTDAGAMQAARAGCIAGAISIPTRYIHSPSEMASLADAEACAALIAAISEDIA